MKRLVCVGLVIIVSLMGVAAVAQDQPTVDVAEDPELGEFLVAANGRTLYMLTKDEEGKSVCFDACAEEWLPYTAEEPLTLPEGLEGELTLIEREVEDKREEPSGYSTQVAYNGMPLYFYHEDTEPGDVNGQDADGIWFVVKPGQQFGEVTGTPTASPMVPPLASPEATPAS